jgi:hypothetical protein
LFGSRVSELEVSELSRERLQLLAARSPASPTLQHAFVREPVSQRA